MSRFLKRRGHTCKILDFSLTCLGIKSQMCIRDSPQLAFKNLVITQIYQVLFDLSPAIELSLIHIWINACEQCRKIDHCINITTKVRLIMFPIRVIQTQVLSNTIELSAYTPCRSNQLTN